MAYQNGKLVFRDFTTVPDTHPDDGHFPTFRRFPVVTYACQASARTGGVAAGASFFEHASGVEFLRITDARCDHPPDCQS